MVRFLKWLGIGAGGVAGIGVLALAGIYALSGQRARVVYDVTPADIAIPTDSAGIATGRHLVRAIAKCGACHGRNYEGGLVLDDPLLGRITAPNITPAGVVVGYTDSDWVRALRHGIRPDGRSVVVMPSYEWFHLSDADMGAMVAYLKTLPAVEHTPPPLRLGPMARLLIAANMFPLLSAEAIDHDAPRPVAPPAGPTAEYGRYLADAGCAGCHGPTLQGARPPATGPDITATGRLAGWTEADFRLALRAGLRPDGTVLDLEMPWNLTTEMTDMEIAALWAYLQSIVAPAAGSRAQAQ